MTRIHAPPDQNIADRFGMLLGAAVSAALAWYAISLVLFMPVFALSTHILSIDPGRLFNLWFVSIPAMLTLFAGLFGFLAPYRAGKLLASVFGTISGT